VITESRFYQPRTALANTREDLLAAFDLKSCPGADQFATRFDFSKERVALVIHGTASGIPYVAEDDGAVYVGISIAAQGAPIQTLGVVTLPLSAKPVRFQTCMYPCPDPCLPVP
jgi:hypothetical protein